MYPIHHFMSWLTFSAGFFIGFVLLSKSNKKLLMLLFLTGLAIGMHEHVFNQDQWFYPYYMYDGLVVRAGYHEPNPFNNALCLAFRNDPALCPYKTDQRWDNPWYFGEKE